ncbi:sugar transferase [Frondihabitans sp. VKM Ac-2883]|uniref:sugar transferase n=1 Tax=Frondihabitans sp. VKM Ac-2883 TaxID=2783823 RepID=UPI00188A3B6B|nr:sugar transferase [Frondihabitans sp. VKM Ac-2883]
MVADRPATHSDWSLDYARRLRITDLLVLVWVVFGVQIAWFGFDSQKLSGRGNVNDLAINYTAVSIVVIVAWMIMLAVYATRDYRVIGGGSAEYRQIVDGSVRLFGLLAIVAFLFKIDLARGYILIALPLGVVVLVFSRWMWRQWLSVKRNRGDYSARVLLVGSAETARHIARELARHPEEGYRVVGACIPAGAPGTTLLDTGVPVIGRITDALSVLDEIGADTVVITGSEELGPQSIRELGWGLEAGQQHLIVAPSLTDIGGPRIHTRPVAGLPLIHVETPRYVGGKQFAKRAFDIVGSTLLIALFSPVLLVVALLVKTSSRGPVLYQQERVGLNGDHFHMLKFRSMRVGADAELAALLAEQGSSDRPLFKVQDDPRVTPIGRVLRRHSLDEFPQLFNVFLGSMSLVGPRPQRDGEVALYDEAARRRLLLKPGMSGLWQVGGRSSLDWEDAIRLDLFYVENWSVMGDVVILWRTMRAVLAPGGDAH